MRLRPRLPLKVKTLTVNYCSMFVLSLQAGWLQRESDIVLACKTMDRVQNYSCTIIVACLQAFVWRTPGWSQSYRPLSSQQKATKTNAGKICTHFREASCRAGRGVVASTKSASSASLSQVEAGIPHKPVGNQRSARDRSQHACMHAAAGAAPAAPRPAASLTRVKRAVADDDATRVSIMTSAEVMIGAAQCVRRNAAREVLLFSRSRQGPLCQGAGAILTAAAPACSHHPPATPEPSSQQQTTAATLPRPRPAARCRRFGAPSNRR